MVINRETILKLPKMRADGLTNIEIARNLKISVYTVGYWFKRLKEAGHEVPNPIRNKGGISKIIL